MARFLHGVEIVEATIDSVPIATTATSIVGIIGTFDEKAGDNIKDREAFLVNSEATLNKIYPRIAVKTAKTDPDVFLGDIKSPWKTSLYFALYGILERQNALIVVIPVRAAATYDDTLKAIERAIPLLRSTESLLGYKPKILGAPYFAHDIAIKNALATTAKKLRAVVVGDVTSEWLVDAPLSLIPPAPPTTPVAPAPTEGGATPAPTAPVADTANPDNKKKAAKKDPVPGVTESATPSGTLENAVAKIDHTKPLEILIDKVQASSDNDRLYYVYPCFYVSAKESNDSKIKERIEPFSIATIASIVECDNTKGWYSSPSNRSVKNLIRPTVALEHVLDDPECVVNKLNENSITTAIRYNGWRLWGNRSLAGFDSRFSFFNIRRTADIIAESILKAHMWAVDMNIRSDYKLRVSERVNSFLRMLTTEGAILGGNCVPSSKNSVDYAKQGVMIWKYAFTPNYPCEHMVFEEEITDEYLKGVI